jgi:hypothetical protein
LSSQLGSEGIVNDAVSSTGEGEVESEHSIVKNGVRALVVLETVGMVDSHIVEGALCLMPSIAKKTMECPVRETMKVRSRTDREGGEDQTLTWWHADWISLIP